MKFIDVCLGALLLAVVTAAGAVVEGPGKSRYETLPDVPALPAMQQQGHVDYVGARIWYGSVGAGTPVILLHGGRASSLSWAHQVRALVAARHRVILIDSRGHGRSTLGEQPLSYALMAKDVLAVMDRLQLRQAMVAGWSDGAIVGLELARQEPRRVLRLFAFGLNVNRRYLVPPVASPVLPLVGPRLRAEYEVIAPDPQGFGRLSAAVDAMQAKQPDYSDAQLASIRGPAITIAAADHDEFIALRHAEYATATMHGARLVVLRDVSHFAPWQDPAGFNAALLKALERPRCPSLACRCDRPASEKPGLRPIRFAPPACGSTAPGHMLLSQDPAELAKWGCVHHDPLADETMQGGSCISIPPGRFTQ
jgi:pimeloyl-ACP methyl ester carboxylesterase